MERYGRSFIETWSYHHSCVGCSWPPRCYTCSFCKREFRSAQALGGHMNVHRRDRARLRQSPPWVESLTSPNPNPNINPRPFPNPTSISTCHVPNLNNPPPPSYATCFLPAQPTPLAPHSSTEILLDEPICTTHAVKSFFVEDLNVLMEDDAPGVAVRKEREVVRLGYVKEELDLELRLG